MPATILEGLRAGTALGIVEPPRNLLPPPVPADVESEDDDKLGAIRRLGAVE